MQHPDEGIIHAWLDGALDEAEQRAVEQHVASCSVCAAAVAEARGMIAGVSRIVSMLDGVPAGVIPEAPVAPVPTRSRWTTRRITPLRATIAAIAASIVIVSATMMNTRHAAAPSPSLASAGPAMSAMDAVRADSIATIAAAPAIQAPVTPTPAPPAAAAEKTDAAPTKAAPPHVSMLEEASRSVAEAKPASRADTAMMRVRIAPTSMTPAPAAPPAIASASAAGVTPPAAKAELRTTMDQRALEDSARARLIAQGAAPAFASAARRAGAVPAGSALQLSSVVATGATSASSPFVGCYRVEGDSTAWPRPLPVRFSLAQVDTAAGATRNVVRVVGPDGRVDTAASAGTWSPLTTTTVHVSFTALRTQEVTLQFASNGTVSAAGATPGRSTPLTLARGSCRP